MPLVSPNSRLYLALPLYKNDGSEVIGPVSLIFPQNPDRITISNRARLFSYDLIADNNRFGQDAQAVFQRGTQAKTIKWDGVFPGPARRAQPHVHDWQNPSTLVQTIENYQGRQRVDVVVSIRGHFVWMPAVIDTFDSNLSGGYGDIMYSISFTRSTRRLVRQQGPGAGAGMLSVPLASGGVRAAKPVPRQYRIVAGDTLLKVSRKVYGTFDRWRDIRDANRRVIVDDANLTPGVLLTIPGSG